MDWLIPHVLPMQVYPGRMWETLCITQQAETTRQDPRGCVRTAWVCSSEGDAKSWVPLNLFRDHADKKGTLGAGDTILLIWVLHSCPKRHCMCLFFHYHVIAVHMWCLFTSAWVHVTLTNVRMRGKGILPVKSAYSMIMLRRRELCEVCFTGR